MTGQINVSREFLRDFAWLANFYKWTPADIEEIKVATREDGVEMVKYWTVLAKAHRNGYRQTAENNFMRLHTWLFMRGELDQLINQEPK